MQEDEAYLQELALKKMNKVITKKKVINKLAYQFLPLNPCLCLYKEEGFN